MSAPIGEATPPRSAMVRNTIDFGEGELVGADIGEAAGEQPSAEAAEEGAEREGGDLGAVDVDAGDRGRELVVAHGAHGAAEPLVGQAPDEIADERERHDAQAEIAVAGSEERGPCRYCRRRRDHA